MYTDRLVIEIDGAYHGHEAQAAHNATRDRVLAAEGLSNAAFPGHRHFQNLGGVAIAIREHLLPMSPV